jgi:regulator of protease activity HflC (stomatin/prohibitin superfamily)
MASNSGPRVALVLGAVVVAGLIAQQFWHWEVERVEVPTKHFLVRVHLWGRDLPEGEILAPDDSYKGIQLDVLPEGRHFLNPLVWSYRVEKLLNVPNGQCAVLTRKFGKEIPPERLAVVGNFLADSTPGQEERGIVREVLQPGDHRINPFAYDVQMVPAVEVKTEQVGVRTLKVGDDPAMLPADKGKGRYTVPPGYRGVQAEPVPSGTYYLNPYVEEILPVEVRSHRVEFTDIEFPSKDGFSLRPHVLVTYRVLPERAPELYVVLADEHGLSQSDATAAEQAKNPVLQKIVLPLIRGTVRIEGSKYDARDFVSAEAGDGKADNPRQKLQASLMEKVAPKCQAVGIAIESITLAEMPTPPELTEQISQRELARVEREKNIDKVGQIKSEQELKSTEAMRERGQMVEQAMTRLKQARVKAEQRTAVEESKLKQDLANAELRLAAARDQAKAVLSKGQAEAAVIELQNEAEVAGLRKAVQGFPSAEHFAQYHILAKLGPALGEIFAADDSEFARLFSAFMTPPSGVTARKPEMPAATAVLPKAK